MIHVDNIQLCESSVYVCACVFEQMNYVLSSFVKRKEKLCDRLFSQNNKILIFRFVLICFFGVHYFGAILIPV